MFDPRFFLATVVSNEDPALRGRVRVRIMGVHTEITTQTDDMLIGIEEKDLPFAQCMYPVTYTGIGGTVPPPSLQPGDWVLGVSLDGPAYQNLMILGLAKAKFCAEALADGSINANDAFDSAKAVISETDAAKVAEKAAEVRAAHADAAMNSEIEQYRNNRGPEYKEAVKIANDWQNSESKTFGIGSGSSGASSIVSTGNAVMNILSYLNGTGDPRISTFNSSSELNLNPNEANDTVVDIVEEGYYSYCWDHYNPEKDSGSAVLPTFAFNVGCGTVDKLLQAYGDPRSEKFSHAQFYNNMMNDGMIEEAAYYKNVIQHMNKTKNEGISLEDKNLKNFKGHQYRLSSQIASKNLRLLGTVVFPTLRSTVTQTQQMLPYYCVEGKTAHEHIGIDLATEANPILAFADGTVQAAMTSNAKDCNAVVILHKGGIKTLYMHMNSVIVKKGQQVKAGQQIGVGGGAGANGPNTHKTQLHFAVKKETKIIDPVSFLKDDIGFAVREISTANTYKKGPLKASDEAYKDLQKLRTSSNIPWSF